MIGHLAGILLAKEAPHLLLEVNGVGYEVEVSTQTFANLPSVGECLKLHTHFVVREDAQLLYGFMDASEKTLFRTLIKVSGVGPKLGLAILSGMNVSTFVRCVMDNDTTSLTKIPGVGKKTAERLMVEVRDRLSDWHTSTLPHNTGHTTGVTSARSDALQALISLGYKSHEADKLLTKVHHEDLSSQELIRLALKQTALVTT